jgi:hypothetical protein
MQASGYLSSLRPLQPVFFRASEILKVLKPWQPATAAQQAARPKRGGGRRPHPLWATVIPALRAWLVENGVPAAGDGGQANMERLAAKMFPPDECPSVTGTIRPKVKAAINARRRELDAAGQ